MVFGGFVPLMSISIHPQVFSRSMPRPLLLEQVPEFMSTKTPLPSIMATAVDWSDIGPSL